MSYLEQAYEHAGILGGEVAELWRPAVEQRQYAVWLNERLEWLRADGERRYAATVRDVAAGRVKPDELPDVMARSDAFVYDSPASRAIVAAVAQSHAASEKATLDAAPAVFAALQRMATDCVSQSVEIVASLPAEVVDTNTAFKASNQAPSILQTWSRLGEIFERYQRVCELARVMWCANMLPEQGFIPQAPERRGEPYAYYGDPRKAKTRGPRELVLARWHAEGALPGLYDWRNAMIRYRRTVPVGYLPAAQPIETSPGWQPSAAAQIPQRVEEAPLPSIQPAPPHVEVAAAVAVVGAPSKSGARTRADEFRPLAS